MTKQKFRSIQIRQLEIPTSNGFISFSDEDGELSIILNKTNGEKKKVSFDLENKKLKASDLEFEDGISARTTDSDGKFKTSLFPDIVVLKDIDGKLSISDLPTSVPIKGDDGKLSDQDMPETVPVQDENGTLKVGETPVVTANPDGTIDDSLIPTIIPRKTSDGRLDVSDLPSSVITGDFGNLFDTRFETKGAVTGDFDELFDTKFGTKGVITGDFASLFDTRFGTKGAVTDSNIASKVASNIPSSVVTTDNIASKLPSGLVYESSLSSLLAELAATDAEYGTVDAETLNVENINVKSDSYPAGELYLERSDLIIRYIDDGGLSESAGSLRFRQGNKNAQSGIYFFHGTSSDETISTNKWWQIRMDSTGDDAGGVAGLNQYGLLFKYKNAIRGYINEGTSTGNNLNNFTGQHRNISDDLNLYSSSSIGLIVISSGEYRSTNSNSITINEALPKISLSNTRNQKSVFGVISNKEDENKNNRTYEHGNFVSVFDKPEDDNRLIVNSIGEGGIWVSNINGDLENGDYITTCEIPGYGMKQDDDLLHNYTVAKITCDCNFDLSSPIYICEEFEWKGQTYRRAFVGCTYHCG